MSETFLDKIFARGPEYLCAVAIAMLIGVLAVNAFGGAQ